LNISETVQDRDIVKWNTITICRFLRAGFLGPELGFQDAINRR